jgi:hypothetical protein
MAEQNAAVDDKVVLTQKQFRRLKREARRARIAGDIVDLFGDPIPKALLEDYDLGAGAGEIPQGLQRKYLIRSNNISRCWNRVQLYAPELMREGQPKKILEMSTAHGGMLEVLRHFGHDVTGNDYVNLVYHPEGEAGSRAIYRDVNDTSFIREVDDYGLPVPKAGEPVADWPYRKIIESIGIPMSLFDAGHTPYPHKDKAFDVLFCFQAIEHYCHPKDWMQIVAEFCRITRQSIVIMLNPTREDLHAKDPSYLEAFNKARMDLRNYDANGFHCTSTHLHWGQALGFKLSAK